jgi:hypothetical protein
MNMIFYTAISNQRKFIVLALICLHTNFYVSNFLYNPDLKEGVLVDFGLAEV